MLQGCFYQRDVSKSDMSLNLDIWIHDGYQLDTPNIGHETKTY